MMNTRIALLETTNTASECQLKSSTPVLCQIPTLRIRRSIIGILLELSIIVTALSIIYAVLLSAIDAAPQWLAATLSYSLYALDAARILVVVEFIRRYFNDLYVLNDKRIRQLHGYLSFSFSITNIKLRDIREIRVEQSIFGRLFRYGTVHIGTASTNSYEIQMKKISSPRELAEEISKRRQRQKEVTRNARPISGSSVSSVFSPGFG